MAINILNDSYSVKETSIPRKEMTTLEAIKSVVSILQENLSSFETYLNSFVLNSDAKMVHSHFSCSNCHKSITGIRYHCSACTDFDLCELCETINDQIHDDSHLFLKIKKLSHSISGEDSKQACR